MVCLRFIFTANLRGISCAQVRLTRARIQNAHGFSPSVHGLRWCILVSNAWAWLSPMTCSVFGSQFNARPSASETQPRWPGVMDRCAVSAGQIAGFRFLMQSRKLRTWFADLYALNEPGTNPGLSQSRLEASSLPRLTYTQPSSPMKRAPIGLCVPMLLRIPSEYSQCTS